MILGWFDARAAKAFGAELAVFYAEKIPLEAQVNEKKFAARTDAALKGLSSRVQDFRARRKLGLYQKAQLGNAFRWALRDAGYDEQYVERLTVWLMTRFN